jgi:glycerol-3-phosphate responsive antiterminator
MTKKEMYGFIKTALNDNPDVVAFCDKEIALLAKKAASAKKAPKKPDVLMDTVYGVLTTDPQFIDDIASAAGISNAKATYRLNALCKTGAVVQGTAKVDKSTKKTYALAIG